MLLPTTASLFLALARLSYAQIGRYVPSDNSLSYRINVPAATASSGTGPIFFQITGPASKQWIALGQGSSMSGAHIFVVYTNGQGNVTISPRLGRGHILPQFNRDAAVTLLAGSGVIGNQLVANVRCDNCLQLSGYRAADRASRWIWAAREGSPLGSTDPDAAIAMHGSGDNGVFTFDLAAATGGDSGNPFVQAPAVAPSSSSRPGTNGGAATTIPANAVPTDLDFDPDSSDYNSGASSVTIVTDTARMLKIHGILMGLAFAVLFPLGAILLRVLSTPHKADIHMGVQLVAFALAIAGLSYGVMLAQDFGILKDKHPVIGMVVMGGLFFQPIVGLIHHWLYKAKGRRTILAYLHTWWGRALMILGIVNGGLGLQLANNTTGGKIAYAVVAGVMGVAWLASVGAYHARGGSAQSIGGKSASSDGENR